MASTDPRIKAGALAILVADDGGLAKAAEYAGVSKSTVSRWAKAAGISPDQYGGEGRKQTADATAARMAAVVKDRGELDELLRQGLALPAARVIAQRLQRVEADEELIEVARNRWKDAMAVEAQASDFGPDAVRQASQATAKAKVDVLVAEAGTISTRDLVGILTRSVHDHLALNGEDADVAPGEVSVVFTAPRPERRPLEVVQLPPEEAVR